MDAFSQELVKFVRQMPDEALLELVKLKLGLLVPPAKREASKRSRPPPEPDVHPTLDRRSMLEQVESVVKAGSGMSSSEVANATGIPQLRVAAALRELKAAGRVFQGGERRFARYAGDAPTAERASTLAREAAKGPARTPRRRTPGA